MLEKKKGEYDEVVHRILGIQLGGSSGIIFSLSLVRLITNV